MRTFCWISIVTFVLLFDTRAEDSMPVLDLSQMRIKPVTPEEAVKTFQVEKGFGVELVVAEPNVTDPVAMAFDEDGRAFVCEFRDYPTLPPKGQLPEGRVRFLSDMDAQGRFTKSSIFVDHLPYPSGVVCWKGGVFVASAPDIWYFKDTDGDGIADIREKVLTGFSTREVYAVLNTLQWGLDNKVYGSSSYNHGAVEKVGAINANKTTLGARDFRFDPTSFSFEAVSGNAEFGNCFDDWGNRFVCNATNVVFHSVLPDQYLARNPNLSVPRVMDNDSAVSHFGKIYPISKPEPWKAARAKFWKKYANTRGDLHPSRFPAVELAPQGFVTSASGTTIYRGSTYSDEFSGNSFTGEPANNLVVRMSLTPKGASIHAERPSSEPKEFLASTDNWFRPVNFVNGPDGCLYMLDMYREVIEDESAVPDEILKALDLTSGRDAGRIYRIIPDNFKHPNPPRMSKASISELVSNLEYRDAWWRETAQRLLVERQDPSAVAPLRELVIKSNLPQAKIHALYTLEALGALKVDSLLSALNDPDYHVRAHALALSEHYFAASPDLVGKALSLAEASEPCVRFQLALSITAIPGDSVVPILVKIAQRDAEDEWIRAAVLCSSYGRENALLQALLEEPEFATKLFNSKLLSELLSLVGATKDERQITAALQAAKSDVVRQRLFLRNIANGLTRVGGNIDNYVKPFRALFEESARNALDPHRSEDERIQEIKFLAYGPTEISRQPLSELLSASQPPAVQVSAVRALATQKRPEIFGVMLDSWRTFGPQVRREIFEAIFRDPARIQILLDGIEQKKVPLLDVEPTSRQQLQSHPDAGIKDRATKLLTQGTTGTRTVVIEKYREALKVEGNASHGRELFLKTCATCHKVGNQGHEIGPNLESVRNHTAEQILIDVLDPNNKVQPNYVTYMLATTDGEVLSGILAEETATSVTLRRAEGAQDTVLRTRIKKLISSNVSLMPEGMEQALSTQDLADLIRFLKNPAEANAK